MTLWVVVQPGIMLVMLVAVTFAGILVVIPWIVIRGIASLGHRNDEGRAENERISHETPTQLPRKKENESRTQDRA